MSPSVVADREAVNLLFGTDVVVGISIDCTSEPAGVYSSRKTVAALLFNDATPSPNRHTTMSPGVNAAAGARLSDFGRCAPCHPRVRRGRMPRPSSGSFSCAPTERLNVQIANRARAMAWSLCIDRVDEVLKTRL